jgi:hypothetical protein
MEDRYWGEQALNALKEGFLTPEETDKWLKEKMHVQTAAK